MTQSDDPQAVSAASMPPSPLSEEQHAAIHRLASEYFCATVHRRSPELDAADVARIGDRTTIGAFVSVKRNDQLRGCCGFLGRPTPLLGAFEHAAQRTAIDDPRMPPVSPGELDYLVLETWLLGDLEAISDDPSAREASVEIGRHGLKIEQGERSGLLLPAVATEQGYDATAFLNAVCRKANLPGDAWMSPDTKLYRFTGATHAAPLPEVSRERGAKEVGELLTREDFLGLSRFCYETIQHALQGSVSNFFAQGVADGMVQSLAISLPGVAGGAVHFMRMSVRPSLPLQTTLQSMAAAIAENIRRKAFSPEQLTGQFGITVGYDAQLLGPANAAEVDGMDASRRSLLVVDQHRSAWLFDPEASPQQLLTRAIEKAGVRHAERARVYSLRTQSTGKNLEIVNRPVAHVTHETRPAAAAGKFYPQDPAALEEALNTLVPQDGPAPARYRAVLVPHAGWRFSGAISAKTLARVDIPSRVLILGPKHTQQGVEFAVAPHQAWDLPGGGMAGDEAFAKRLVEVIPSLELDAAAHSQEHGVEVLLPILRRLAPSAQVTGVALSNMSFQDCCDFADKLGQLLSEHPDVLLVISSDMNHFANEEETRRLDALAMRELEALQPEGLYATCQAHGISMCGRVPAVIVLEALKRQQRLRNATRVAYDTSAAASGNADRVVGYCGMLFR